MRAAFIAVAIAACCLPRMSARTQESVEDRMRDALRQSVMEMRAAQDQAAQAQADLQKAQADKAALQAQLDAATAKLAETSAGPAAKPADLAALSAQIKALQAQTAALQQQNAQLQARYQATSDLAHAKDDESRHSAAAAKANEAALQTCKGENTRLVDVSEQVLHLYETLSFRAILLKSYEPLIGSARVKLENLVQDYDDKIHDQEYLDPVARRK
jgi:chromosome segregation ATPase